MTKHLGSDFKAARPMRWWIPFGILTLSAGAIFWIQLSEFIFKPQATALVVILSVVLLALWYILLTGLPFWRRLILLGGLFVVVFGIALVLKKLTRIEGSYTGAGFPRLAWIWTPKRDARLPLSLVATTNAPTIDTSSVKSLPAFPEFLGPGRSNVVHGVRLARDWKAQPPQEIWRRPVGLGWSSFAIAEGRAITQEQRDDDELVVCYGLLTGQVLWAHTNKARFSEGLGGDGPRATPTVVSNRVYALGATGILDCLDAATGKWIWSRETLSEAKAENLTWGKSSSPLVFDDTVVVSGGDSGPLLLAYHRESGELLWRGGTGGASYTSPVLATIAGHRQVLSVNAHSVTGHDPTGGKVLWTFDWPGDFPKCAQPIVAAPDKVFLTASYGLGSLLLQLTPSEGGTFSPSQVWANKNMKAKFANVSVRDGFVYGLDDGILACVELATGARRWKGGRYGHGQLLLVEDLLLVQTEPGEIILVEANPDRHVELARWPALKSKTWNNPALSGNYLLVRNDREAVCLKLPVAPSGGRQ